MFLVHQPCGGFGNYEMLFVFRNNLEGYESFTLENCHNSSKLEYRMPTTDETRVHDKTGGTETCSNKSDKNGWLEMVNDPGKRFMFQEAQN
jgi:hypothetical protein